MHVSPGNRRLAAGLAVLLAAGVFAFVRAGPGPRAGIDSSIPDPTADGAATVAVDAAADSAAGAAVAAPGRGPSDAVLAGASDAVPGAADQVAAAGSARAYRAGEDPDFAARMGWPVAGPPSRSGAILPDNRIVCYYGNPNSTRMGALGEFPKAEMLDRLLRQVDDWRSADPATPVTPCLHMVAVVAQGEAGVSGHYRSIMRDADVSKVYGWAREVDGIFFVDIQVGTDDIRNILPRFEWILKEPDVHLGIDPEFYMKGGERPGTRIGTMDAADINYATDYLARLVDEYDLPPKVFVVHRFTQRMVTNADRIRLDPRVQIVMHMDGWGPPWLKRDSYRDYVVKEPVQYAGFKIFYHNDTRSGDAIMTPADMLRLRPRPLYIQYQ